jgi:transcriptional regulator with XRE-family HTH domain
MNNLAAIMKAKGVSDAALAQKLNTTKQSVGRYKRGDRGIALPVLKRLAAELEVSVAEILGEPNAEPEKMSFDGQQFRPVPIFSIKTMAAAHGSNNQPVGHHPFPVNWLASLNKDIQALTVIEVAGDSMWDTLHSGDHVLIDTSQRNFRHEGLYAIAIDNTVEIRRISMHPTTKLMTVRSDNPRYPIWENVGSDGLQIFGRVVWIGRLIG